MYSRIKRLQFTITIHHTSDHRPDQTAAHGLTLTQSRPIAHTSAPNLVVDQPSLPIVVKFTKPKSPDSSSRSHAHTSTPHPVSTSRRRSTISAGRRRSTIFRRRINLLDFA
ncbi:hypothetical protein Q3G72_030016 [Acer saccharum]|nr:hypothetical protein Q3G72_030016 [Acer saccharum]